MSFIVAIDGPAGSGKGTITKIVGDEMNLAYIDTGAMYRCVTLYMLQHNISLDDVDKIKEMLKVIDIKLKNENGVNKFYLDGEDVSQKIRENDVNNFVSPVSHVIQIREAMVDLQRKIGNEADAIMEGRDIGTNVFPNANVKIYLDATPEERARRRLKQNEENGIESNYDEVLQNILFRDSNDRSSSVAPLKQAEDAIYIDSTNMTIDEVASEVIRIVKEKKEKLKDEGITKKDS